jgi:transposase
MLTAVAPDVNPSLCCADESWIPEGASRQVRRHVERQCQASLTDFVRWQREQRDLFEGLEAVPDGRDPLRTTIPLPAILLSILCLFWLDLRSLRSLEDRLHRSAHLRCVVKMLGWPGTISDDTLAAALDHTDVDMVRAILHRQGKREFQRWSTDRWSQSVLGRRLKAVGAGHLAAKMIVAIDGHHLFTTEHRSCADCYVTTVTRTGADGLPVEVEQHQHKVVVAHWIGVHPAIVLDFEPILPGDNELTAAYRLIERLGRVYGDMIGTVTADALYDGDPFRLLIRSQDWHAVYRHKDERRDPGRSGRATLDRHDPQRQKPDGRHREGPTCYEGWDVPEGNCRYLEVRRTRPLPKGREGQAIQVGACITTWPARSAPWAAIAIIMETRWYIENTAFHELAKPWAWDRGFAHQNRPTAVWAMAGLALVAFNAFQAYVYRHLKLDPAKPQRTLLDIRRDLFETLCLFRSTKQQGHARAP